MRHWRLHMTTDRWRQGGLLLASAVLGFMAVMAWGAADLPSMQALDEEVMQLQARLQKPAVNLTGPTAQLSDDIGPDEPGLAQSDVVWPWLQQRLQAHGFVVVALRPQAVASGKSLPEQTVTMRLQGRWQDWLAFEQALHAHAPWWVLEQWQIVPSGQQPGEVRIELQARLGFQPTHRAETAGQRAWPDWQVSGTRRQEKTAHLFAPAAWPEPPALAASGTPVALPSDPAQWPLQDLRFLGTWSQEGVVHAVLGAGADKVVVKPGQRIGREGYRVRQIGDDRLELGASGTGGVVLRRMLEAGE